MADSKAAEPDLEQITYKRRKQAGKRELDLSGLPTERVIHELPEAERVCLECGGPLHQCGQAVARRELVYIPAKYKVVEHVQAAYSCRRCEQENDHVPMKKGAVPAPLIPGSGIASPSLLAHILNSKYTLALPLYRQEQELARIGVPVSRQTMANWIMTAHQRWFSDFVQTLRRELLSNEILHADETTLMVLQEPGRKARQKSYVWVYRTSGDTKHPVVLYDYQPSRGGECASRFLEGFSGLLHTDGYEAYHCKLPPEITTVGCWAHMRRKFTDTLKSLPKEIRDKSPAQVGLDYCDRLFHLEVSLWKKNSRFRSGIRPGWSAPNRWRSSSLTGQKRNVRRTRAKKYAWRSVDLCHAAGRVADERIPGWQAGTVQQSGRAGRAALCCWAENWLFSNTPKGADASAAVYSIVETAKANGLRPFPYLKLLLERLSLGVPAETCLPWDDSVQALCK